MGAAKKHLMEMESLDDWADGILLEFEAISECENHGEYSDNLDSGAVEEAAQYASEHPPEGLSPQEAADLVRNRINEIGEECGYCAKNRDRD